MRAAAAVFRVLHLYSHRIHNGRVVMHYAGAISTLEKSISNNDQISAWLRRMVKMERGIRFRLRSPYQMKLGIPKYY